MHNVSKTPWEIVNVILSDFPSTREILGGDERNFKLISNSEFYYLVRLHHRLSQVTGVQMATNDKKSMTTLNPAALKLVHES